jgi:hypothetical protein
MALGSAETRKANSQIIKLVNIGYSTAFNIVVDPGTK